MPKMKTKSSAKKRFKITGSGKIKRKHAFKSHILTKKSKEGGDVVGKDTTISKILTKNLQSIKKLADKEGISINKLINILKKGE